METAPSVSTSGTAEAATAVPMLPADQVAAIIEQMKAEQVQLLKEQQTAIVEQVMQSLRESGMGQAMPARATSSTSVQRGKKCPHSQKLSKLEKNLHTLVLHSLNESGLNFPHVQKNGYSNEQAHCDLQQTRPSGKALVQRESKAVIVSRNERDEREDVDMEASNTDLTSQCCGEMSAESVRPTSASQRTNAAARLTPLRESPLRVANARSSLRRKKVKRRPRYDQNANDAEEDAVEGSEFEAVRSKVGHKTQAILDRSRFLLAQVKGLPPTNHSSGMHAAGDDKTFVHKMRKKLVEVEAVKGDGPRPGSAAQNTPLESSLLRHNEQPQRSATQEDSTPPLASADDLEAVERDAHDPVTPTNVTCEDIDILCPPKRSPENEHEWENELARQILTIYATSVKAKVSMGSPQRSPSHQGQPGTASATRLGTSCSLPALGTRSPSPSAPLLTNKLQRPPSPERAVVHYSWEPSQRLQNGKVVINMPKVPQPIWFAGTGAVKAVWCAIAEGFHGSESSPSKRKQCANVVGLCEHEMCDEIRRLEAKQQYLQCITTLETLLISLVRSRGVDQLDVKLWKQLVVTCNAFASRCVDYKRFPLALQLIKQAEHLIHNSILVDATTRLELLAYLYDTYAHYYYRRGKSHAGLQYMFKAQEIHTRQSSWSHVAKCQLHIANLLAAQGKHDQAITYMASILKLIEDNKLEDQAGSGEGTASAQKICLAAVCYNNLAIEQLHLREFEAASVSTGNAKRLAKLCLSYSNRWLAQFDATSNCVDLAIATLMEDLNASQNGQYQMK